MDANMIIKLGDKVQVRVGKGRYGTIVEYVEDDATFFISPLFSMQKQISLVEGQIYTINAINKRGLFEFEVLVLETDYLGFNKNVPMTKLFMVTEPRRHQRRDAFRVGIMIDLVVREPADDDMPETEISEYHSNTLNLSESGMLFQTKKSYPPGTVLRCDLILNKYGMDVTLHGIKAEVIRAKPPEFDGTLYRTGVSFKEMHRQDSRTLVKFIMMSQREIQQKQGNIRD